jgi:hypothetical protein
MHILLFILVVELHEKHSSHCFNSDALYLRPKKYPTPVYPSRNLYPLNETVFRLY